MSLEMRPQHLESLLSPSVPAINMVTNNPLKLKIKLKPVKETKDKNKANNWMSSIVSLAKDIQVYFEI